MASTALRIDAQTGTKAAATGSTTARFEWPAVLNWLLLPLLNMLPLLLVLLYTSLEVPCAASSVTCGHSHSHESQ